MQETFTKEAFWSELDAIGEDEVRIRLFVGKVYGDVGAKRALAEEWIRRREESRQRDSAVKRDAREEETLSIARSAAETSKEALRIAKHEKIIALWAAAGAVVAAAAAVAALIIQYV